MDICKCVIYLGITIFMISSQPILAVRIDWTLFGGEDSRLAVNETRSSFVGDIYGTIFGIWEELNYWNPDYDSINDVNSTSAPRSPFPPGLEGMGYISPQCLNETMTVVADYYNDEPYAVRIIHSSGTLSSAAWEITGTRGDYGLFDECRNVKAKETNSSFDAEYCLVRTTWPDGVTYSFGQCVPASCSTGDMYVFMEILKETLNLEWRSAYVFCEHTQPLDGATLGVIATCSVLGTLLITGTMYHLVAIYLVHQKGSKNDETANTGLFMPRVCNHDQVENDAATVTNEGSDENPLNGGMSIDDGEKQTELHNRSKAHKYRSLGGQILMCFSVLHNLRKIFDTAKTPGMLSALNGMRVISMLWVILGHVWYISPSIRIIGNRNHAEEEDTRSFIFQFILYGVYAVDTFFLLSGLLVTYHTMKALTKAEGKLKWRYFYLHRYLRITPLYMFVIAVYVTLPKFIGSGPLWNNNFTLYRLPCKFLWWSNLLYINNLFPFPGQLHTQCMGWSWYLANDMQFFVASPLILILLYKNYKIGLSLILSFLLISYASTVGISVYFGLNVGLTSDPKFNERPLQNLDWLYGKPWYRCQAYLIGMVVGYVLFKLDGKKLHIPRPTNVACWFIAFAMAFAVIFGLYNKAHGHELSQATAVFHKTFKITAWSIAMGWIAFACSIGYGGPINTVLSWPIWIPLARITFSAYLVHLIVVIMYFTGLRTPLHIAMPSMTLLFIGLAVVSYAVALLFSLVVEAPIRGLERLIFKRKHQKLAAEYKYKVVNS